ncbi:MAG: peptidoglycan-binding domain-containing protein [Hyphomicrobiaceae bacterium]
MSRQTKFGLLAAAAIFGSTGFNLFVMQPDAPRGSRPERAYRGLDQLPGAGSTALNPPVPAAARAVEPAGATGGKRSSASEPASDPARTIRAVQQALAVRGYYTGVADGVLGLATRAAIMDFEQENGQPLTGEASPAVLKSVAMAPRRGEIRAAGVTMANDQRPSAEAEGVIRTVQQSLDRLGYRPGPADGRMGEATAAAIRAFEADQSLDVTGRVYAELVLRLAERTKAGHVANSD